LEFVVFLTNYVAKAFGSLNILICLLVFH
jgi:hypothetical protein